MAARLKEMYKEKVYPALKEQFNYDNVMMIPKLADVKVRRGMPVGAKVTLRGDSMYEFIDKLFNIALPRVRDFKGVSKNSFDGRGNYSMGIKEQLIFPEINYDKVDTIKGMNIVFTTTAKTDEEAQALLAGLGMPFEK